MYGKGTKVSKYLVNHDKIYEARIKLGIETDTLDIDGQIIKKINVDKSILTVENIQNVLKTFIGKQEQEPPIYSAIKVNGKKLYEYARQGQEIEIKPRQIEIYEIKLLKIDTEQNTFDISINCSKGTYIRSLARDIAKSLGTVGCISKLNRVKVRKFWYKSGYNIRRSTKT